MLNHIRKNEVNHIDYTHHVFKGICQSLRFSKTFENGSGGEEGV